MNSTHGSLLSALPSQTTYSVPFEGGLEMRFHCYRDRELTAMSERTGFMSTLGKPLTLDMRYNHPPLSRGLLKHYPSVRDRERSQIEYLIPSSGVYCTQLPPFIHHQPHPLIGPAYSNYEGGVGQTGLGLGFLDRS